MSKWGCGPKELDESIAELTRKGQSASQIARRLGIAERTVQRARIRTGTSRTPHRNSGRRYSPEFLAVAEKRLDEGWPIREIARTYGVNEKHLSRHFPGRGWTIEQAAQQAVVRKAEMRLFAVLENQHRNASHLLPLADVL